MQHSRQIVIYDGEDGYYVVEVPSLPGYVSQGKTQEEALSNIQEAIEVFIETLKAHDQPVP
ncbi:MAG: type II toxin-antitoxin system HicB family antitoxin [Chloroflexota bacterium]